MSLRFRSRRTPSRALCCLGALGLAAAIGGCATRSAGELAFGEGAAAAQADAVAGRPRLMAGGLPPVHNGVDRATGLIWIRGDGDVSGSPGTAFMAGYNAAIRDLIQHGKLPRQRLVDRFLTAERCRELLAGPDARELSVAGDAMPALDRYHAVYVDQGPEWYPQPSTTLYLRDNRDGSSDKLLAALVDPIAALTHHGETLVIGSHGLSLMYVIDLVERVCIHKLVR